MHATKAIASALREGSGGPITNEEVMSCTFRISVTDSARVLESHPKSKRDSTATKTLRRWKVHLLVQKRMKRTALQRDSGCSTDTMPSGIRMTFAALTFALICPMGVDAFVPLGPLSGQSQTSFVPFSHLSSTRDGVEPAAVSMRSRIMNTVGLSRSASKEKRSSQRETKKQEKIRVSNVRDLEKYFNDEAGRFQDESGEIDYHSLLRTLHVEGDTQIIGSPDHPEYVHPVARAVHERRKSGSRCVEGERPDGFRIALIVEGGGMRGCISAGMICALHHLGLRDTVDVVYGASAGSLIGAYFITEQLPWFGPELYYDKLTTAGKEFIDTTRILRTLGLGLVDPRLYRDVITRPENGKPVLSLPFLLGDVMQHAKPLDWETFVERQKVQPLKVVASALKSERPFIMDMENGHFSSLDELSKCMHASCLLPGIAGPLMNIRVGDEATGKPKFVVQNNLEDPDYEPLGDALVYAPIPYREAQKDGATHVIAIRSRADGTDVTGKGGAIERLIAGRYFLRKNKLPRIFQRLSQHWHKKLYAENVLDLNAAASSDRDYRDTSEPHVLTIALSPGSEEISRLETGREAIFEGVRRGFARAYDALVEDPRERGRGAIVAEQYFPDEIMSYDPTTIDRVDASAFSVYLNDAGVTPSSWNGTEYHCEIR